jgi:hypothetical protein
MRLFDLWRYFFPKPTRHQRLRRVKRELSSETSAYGKPPEHLSKDIELLRAVGIARTDADAYRVILSYPSDTDVFTIIRLERPKRRTQDIRERLRTRMIKLVLGQNYFRRREKKRRRKRSSQSVYLGSDLA